MVNELIKNSYDEVKYQSNSYYTSSIDRIYSTAKMYGLSPANPHHANVLELGCAGGGNILGQAINHKDSFFYGIDISDEQIKIGKEAIEEIGINNIKLFAMDICDVLKNFETKKFDYIIAHGIYSWVPDFVRVAILELLNSLLSPNGVALISFNTYPGWKFTEVTRDFMRFSAGVSSQNDKLEVGLNALKFEKAAYASTKVSKNEVYQNLTRQLKLNNIEVIEGTTDKAYLYHEYLELVNQPYYLTDFVTDAENFHLSYIADMMYHFSYDELANQSVKQYAKLAYKDRLSKDQMFDFLNSTKFRVALLTKDENNSKLKFENEEILDNISDMHLAFNTDMTELKAKVKDLDIEPLVDALLKAYRSSISVKEAISLVPNGNLMPHIYDLLAATNSIVISYEPLNALCYKKGQIRLKEFYRDYIKYFINNNNHLLSCAAPLNETFAPSKFELETMLDFDGKNSLEDIIKNLKSKFAKQKLIPTIKKDGEQKILKSKSEQEKYFKDNIEEIARQLSKFYFFERF